MPRFPRDAPFRRGIRALQALETKVVRRGKHISMIRANPDGSVTPLTMPDHLRLKSSTLRTICAESGISRVAPSFWGRGLGPWSMAICFTMSVACPSDHRCVGNHPAPPARGRAGNTRWERGHPVLVEGWKPSFPGCPMQEELPDFAPVFYFQAGDSAKLSQVVCYQYRAQGSSMGGDQKVVLADWLPHALQFRSDRAVVSIRG